MKCTLQRPQAYWTSFGRRAAATGMSLDETTRPVRLAVVKEWITEGHRLQTKKMARKAAQK